MDIKVSDIIKDNSVWLPSTDYNKKRPKLSILMPTYGRGKNNFFKRTVKSYIEQDRIIENIKLYNTANANLGKQGVSESDLAQYFFDKGNEKYNEKTHKKILKAYNKANRKKSKIEKRREQAVESANKAEGKKKNTNNK